MSARRGGIPGPESRTGLVRPAMSEAEFEKTQARESSEASGIPAPHIMATGPIQQIEVETPVRGSAPTKTRISRSKPAKSRRVQRMFAIEEEVDKKLWLYAIHMGKDRSEVVNDLLRPLVASMVLYDSRDRRSAGRVVEVEGQGVEIAEA
jgi:hypothetical protein